MAESRRPVNPLLRPLGVNLAEVVERMHAGRAVRRRLEPWGRVHVDRAIPCLFVYRKPSGAPSVSTRQLVTSQASFLFAPGDSMYSRDVTTIVRTLASAARDDFGACLVVEIVMMDVAEDPDGPLFRVVHPRRDSPGSTVDALESALSRIVIPDFPSRVEVIERAPSRETLPPLLGARRPGDAALPLLRVEIKRIYYDEETGREFPMVHRRLRKELARALKRAAFEFTNQNTTQRPPHYHALGRSVVMKAVWEVDRRLADVANSFDFLLLTTPRNAEEAWRAFHRGHCERAPLFSYRPVPFDPVLAKRELYSIPIERIEDPTLADLFRGQQEELDRKITMVGDRRTKRFKYASAQLFGAVDGPTLKEATRLLDTIPSRARESVKGGQVAAPALAARAREEIAYLKESLPGMDSRVDIRDDISGLMVSRGNLLIGSATIVPASRVNALLQHEVGTHVLTYFNGGAQPFRQLRTGLPAYEELQEGLAVLAEYLAGGLSRPRVRLLAARVLAVHRMLDGASFVDVFRELDRHLDFSQRTAFMITMRVFRSGGQTKDAVYLRGLMVVLRYLKSGEPLDRLFVGKIGIQHLPVIRELEWRRILVAPPLRPRYMNDPEAQARLERLSRGATVLGLLGSGSRRIK